MKKITVSCAAIMLLCAMLLCGCAGDEDFIGNPKTFADDQISITLTDKFEEERDVLGFYTSYLASGHGVVVYREAFDAQTGLENVPLSDYFNEKDPKDHQTETVIKTNGDLKYWEGTSPTMYSHTYCFKGNDAFFRFRFFCSPDVAEEKAPYFLEWAKSIIVG